jgi:hypothetical protein
MKTLLFLLLLLPLSLMGQEKIDTTGTMLYQSSGTWKYNYYIGMVDGSTGIVNYDTQLKDGTGKDKRYAYCIDPGTYDYSGNGTNKIHLNLSDILYYKEGKWNKKPTGVDTIYPGYKDVHNLSEPDPVADFWGLSISHGGSIIYPSSDDLQVYTPKIDTVAVWMDCADTTGGRKIAYNVSIKGWEVRKVTSHYWGSPDPNPDGTVYAIAVERPIWSTVAYLDSFKRPLTGYLVWATEEIK